LGHILAIRTVSVTKNEQKNFQNTEEIDKRYEGMQNVNITDDYGVNCKHIKKTKKHLLVA
jgi:hypothetical protein